MINDIKTLSDLQKDTTNSLYELQGEFFVEGFTIGIYKFTLTDRHSGRPWLLSYDLFNGDTGKVDLICTANGIINPFSIKAGDDIFYPDPSNPDSSRASTQLLNTVIANLKVSNAGKSKKTDPNRTVDNSKKTFREMSKKVPLLPNITAANQNISYSEGTITLKPNF